MIAYDFHNCTLVLEAESARGGFEYWKWLLDPWRCQIPSMTADTMANDAIGKTVKLIYGKNDRPAPNLIKIGELGAGLYRCVISQDEAGNTHWECVWKAKKDVLCSYEITKDFSEIRLLKDASMTMGFQPYIFLSNMMPTVMLAHDAITFHGALMEHDGRGIILSASSGTGKTTHARFWRDNKRALILNGDRATCCKEANGSWTGFSLPWSGSSGEQINRDVPLKAFVFLEQSDENVAERLEGIGAFSVVKANLLYPGWNVELTVKALDCVDDFLARVPVFRLKCRPDAEAVEALDKALREL